MTFSIYEDAFTDGRRTSKILKTDNMNYRKQVEYFFSQSMDILFPIRLGRPIRSDLNFGESAKLLNGILENNVEEFVGATDVLVRDFIDVLPDIKTQLEKDIDAIYNGDPAAASRNEIIIAYPGFYAIAAYRIAHYLLQKKVPLIPRVIMEHVHSYTGIDIHPGATIGESLCIDHGTGVVIGETTIIGDHVKIYQGVTLGAFSTADKNIPGKRHPTIGNGVTIYANAIILGGDTQVGDNCVIGGKVWITKSLPKNSKIYYQSAENAVKGGPGKQLPQAN